MRYVNISLVFHPVISLSLEGTVVTQSNHFGVISKHFFLLCFVAKEDKRNILKLICVQEISQ